MQSNQLQLNTAKTKVIWCTSNRRQHQLAESWYWPRHTNYFGSRPMNLRRLRRVDEDPRLQNCPAASMYYANCAAFVVLCRQQYYSHWSSRWCCPVCTMATPRLPVYLEIARQTAVGDQCRSTTCLLCTKVRAHNAATPRPSLVAGTRANWV